MRESWRLAGQCLMIGFDGLEPTAEVRHLLRSQAVGGIILFSRNVSDAEQLTTLVAELQDIARAAGHDTPLLVSIDQEGGRVARLRDPWIEWPPMRALGRIGSEELVRRLGAALAEQLAPCGIRLDFAPVVDVDTNPKNPVIGDRSFGDDPSLVARLGAALIRGLQDTGVAACAKHFPGHGDTDRDSHIELPAVDHSPARLQDVELRPFRAALAAQVASVMTAHVVVRALDEKAPATLSPHVVRDVLRRKMGFDGVVVSDDLEMKAIAETWGAGAAAVRALQAGCDLVLVCHTADAQAEAHEALVKAVEAEVITVKDIEDAALRVRRLKERFVPREYRPTWRAADWRRVSQSHRLLAEEIASRGAACA
jgi:beta-N-acetylhexosaminidase